MIECIRGVSSRIPHMFTVNDTATDPVGLKITIKYGSTSIITATDMTKVSTGYYYYDWTPAADATLGNYSAIFTGTWPDSTAFSDIDVLLATDSVSAGSWPTSPSTVYCVAADVYSLVQDIDLSDLNELSPEATFLSSDFIAQQIDHKSKVIDDYCKKSFKSVSVTWYMNGTGTNRIVCPFKPVIEVTAAEIRTTPANTYYTFSKIRNINVNDRGTDIATLTALDTDVDMWVDCLNGIFVIPPTVMTLSGSYVVSDSVFLNMGDTYNLKFAFSYGYTSTTRPSSIRDACAKLVAIEVLRKKGMRMSGGASSKQIDQYRVTYKNGAYGAIIDDWMNNPVDGVMSTLNRYKGLSVGGGNGS